LEQGRIQAGARRLRLVALQRRRVSNEELDLGADDVPRSSTAGPAGSASTKRRLLLTLRPLARTWLARPARSCDDDRFQRPCPAIRKTGWSLTTRAGSASASDATCRRPGHLIDDFASISAVRARSPCVDVQLPFPPLDDVGGTVPVTAALSPHRSRMVLSELAARQCSFAVCAAGDVRSGSIERVAAARARSLLTSRTSISPAGPHAPGGDERVVDEPIEFGHGVETPAAGADGRRRRQLGSRPTRMGRGGADLGGDAEIDPLSRGVKE
jgi:hypothetical protein